MVRPVSGNSSSISSNTTNSYTVRAGDTLSHIAQRAGVSLNDLIRANPQIKNPNLIHPGQQINIPARATGSLSGIPVSRGTSPTERPVTTAPSSNPPQPVSTRSLTYDGTRPAPGTTNTRAWEPINAPLTNDPSQRSAANYANVINQFAVANNPRYTPRNGNTYCNIFLWDVTRAMRAEIPHWVDRNGNPTGVGQGRELNANATHRWMHEHGARFGWRQVSAEEAQRLANQGFPTVFTWENRGGIGHVGVVRPGNFDSRLGPAIAQAGARNTNNAHVGNIFPGGYRVPTYWVNDRGTSVGSSQPAPTPRPAPSPTPGGSTSPGTTRSIPQSNLSYGDNNVDVKRLQDRLVELGYMTREQVNTGYGNFGPRTLDAVKRFQRNHGIPPTGNFGPLTRAAMERALSRSSSANARPVPQSDLRYGDNNADVKKLQDRLVELGYMTREQVNTGYGNFGPRTLDAVKRFQRDHGIPPTGNFGPLTRAAMERAIAGGATRPSQPSTPPTPRPPVNNTPPTTPVGNIPRTGNAFIDSIADDAIRSQRATGVPASVTIAQAILESGWGQSSLSRQAHNYFGIKGEGPAGHVVMPTREYLNGQWVTVNAKFRKYNSPAESFIDHGRFFIENSRYRTAMQHTNDAIRFAREIHRAGYATDPAYSDKLISIINRYNLTQFDAIARR
ncbi:MAG: peptidoglycan-binding protein [Acidobacteriota bacterium]|nr:peptidoglycan-binding protein [Blastocatellia bacterium]MDW8411553.1 peptidoglycan-binding protein [Acidobacteriota bacterium]